MSSIIAAVAAVAAEAAETGAEETLVSCMPQGEKAVRAHALNA